MKGLAKNKKQFEKSIRTKALGDVNEKLKKEKAESVGEATTKVSSRKE